MYTTEQNGKKGELSKVLETFKKEFNGKKVISIRAKDKYRRQAIILRANKVVNGHSDSEGSKRGVAPGMSKASPFGYFINEDGQKIKVIYSTSPPRFENGRPKFTEANLPLQEMSIDTSDVDKALFWFAFSKDVDSGFEKPLDPKCKYEIARPEVVAENRLKQLNSISYEAEIAFENTRMSYESAKGIMEILGMDVSGNEASDRMKLLDDVKNNKELQGRYEVAKKSILKDLPKHDLTNTSTLAKEADKQGVVFVEKGYWMLKNQIQSSIKL